MIRIGTEQVIHLRKAIDVLDRLGQLIARRALWFALTWAVLVVAAFALAVGGVAGQGLFDRLTSGAPQVPGESQRGLDVIAGTAPTGATIFLLLDHVDPASATVRTAVVDARTDLARLPGVAAVGDPYAAAGGPSDPRSAPYVAADGSAVLMAVHLNRDLGSGREDVVTAAVDARLREVGAQVPGSTALVGGVQQLVTDVTTQVKLDLRLGEGIALPVSMLVMVLVFGGFLAAGLPIVGAVASIAGALASLLAFSYLIELDASVVNVVTVLGLGLCIDYGLLLASRYREELRRLHADAGERPSASSLEGALRHTMATAGRTVTYSAVTVAISLSGLLLFRAHILRAIGAAGVSVVVVALLVALTFVPAMLALAGDRMIRPGVTQRLPLVGRLARRLGDVAPAEGAFSRLARAVQRRAVLVVVVVVAGLLTLASPVLGMQLVNSGVGLLPKDAPQRQLFDGLAERFPLATQAPVIVVAHAPPAQARAYAAELATLPGVASVDPLVEQGTSAAGPVTVIGVRTTGAQSSPQARALVERLRAARPGFPTEVTGQSALLVDFLDDIRRRAPLAVGLVVLATFLLLFFMTGSVLVPVKALLLNVVSLGASLGVVVWVFQDGHLESLLGFSSIGAIDTMIPALVLAFAFGLSMDYEVFLLSRIKELRDRGYSNDEAVVAGLQRSGRIITSAALIVVIVFAGFVAGQLLLIKETGVALAVAVALDATLVRMLLVPATMTLLGEWNWWAPAPLRSLHQRFGLRED